MLDIDLGVHVVFLRCFEQNTIILLYNDILWKFKMSLSKDSITNKYKQTHMKNIPFVYEIYTTFHRKVLLAFLILLLKSQEKPLSLPVHGYHSDTTAHIQLLCLLVF